MRDFTHVVLTAEANLDKAFAMLATPDDEIETLDCIEELLFEWAPQLGELRELLAEISANYFYPTCMADRVVNLMQLTNDTFPKLNYKYMGLCAEDLTVQ